MTTRAKTVPAIIAVVLLVLFALVPFMGFSTGGFLPNALNSPGSLQVIAVVLTIAALAVTFDIVFGYVGLMSFGHALFFTLGAYGFAMSMAHTNAGFWTSALVGLLAAGIGGLLVNAAALRATHIAFAMVTLAFAQLVSIAIGRNYFGSGGEEGITLPFQKMPTYLTGIANMRNIYWVALVLLIFVIAVAFWITSTQLGRMWQAIRENELRVKVMGVNTYLYKLIAASLSSLLAGACGIVYVLVLGTAVPAISDLFFSLGLIVMVVLGGRGYVWGAALGGAVYTLLEQRLPAVAGSDAISGLPKFAQIPLSEPQLLLGLVFIAFIYFVPGGLAGSFHRFRHRRAPQ